MAKDTKDVKDVSDLLENQEWITPIAQSVQNAVNASFEMLGEPGQKSKNVLHGKFLGHPLHPVLTDVPIGAWTLALIFDALDELRGRDDFSQAADLAVGIGLIGALGAAKTGLTDYAASGKQAPNSGLAHGVLNIGATALYATSLVLRRNGNRSAGRVASLVGYGVLNAAAYLGGELVYGQRIGVDHAQREDLPGDWSAVLKDADLEENKLTRTQAGEVALLLLRRNGKIFAIGEICSHLGGPLSEGKLNCDENGCNVQCPWHDSRFDLATGAVLDSPATYRQPVFETRVRGGQIEIKATSANAREA